MRRWHLGLGLLIIALAVWPALPAAGQAVAVPGKVTLDRWVSTTGADFASGTFEGTLVFTNTGEITGTAEGQVELVAGTDQGHYTSVTWETAVPCRAAGLLYQGQVPQGAALSFALRAQDAAGEWTAWTVVPIGAFVAPTGLRAGEMLVEFPAPMRLLQYQVTFSGPPSPVLEAVVVVALGAERVPALQPLAPWQESDAQPHPVSPARWGGVVVSAGPTTATVAPSTVVIQPATWAPSGPGEAAAALEMLQYYQREVLAWDDLLYSYLVDPEGRVYQGRVRAAGDVLYVGLLGAHPSEEISPTAEDSLVALLDWWAASLPPDHPGLTILAPGDPLLPERIQARREAGVLRRNEWFLARGISETESDEWLLLANPDDRRTLVTAELYREGIRIARRTVRLPALSRGSLLADSLTAAGTFWTRISSDGNVLVERAIYYGHDGDDSAGLDVLSREWYLPGGSQESGFTTTLALLNPGRESITATVTVYAQSGPARERSMRLAPRTRVELAIRDLYTGTTPLGSRVSATGLIAVEQEVRFAANQGGYGLPGSPLLSRRWTFSGVETEDAAVTVLALLNPYTTPVTLTLTLMSEDGTLLRRPYTAAPGEQRLNLNTLLPELALAAEVQAGRPIAAARITFFADFQSAQATLGAVRPARHWYLPEGATGDPFEALLLVANPNPVPTVLEATFLGGAGELGRVQYTMPAHSRLTVPLNDVLPNVGGFATVVVSDWPVVVERSMYLHERQGGHACLGIAR